MTWRLVFIAAVVVQAQDTVDYRQTVIKPGYGVNFDRIDHIVMDGSTPFYTHTWALQWPTIPTIRLPFFNCSAATDWVMRCEAINSYISKINAFAYETLSSLAVFLSEGKKLVPPVTNDTFFDGGSKRKRRDISDSRLPSWLKTQQSETVDQFFPSHTIGTIWSDLTNTPGPGDVDELTDHLRSVGSAVYENMEGVKQFNRDVWSVSKLICKGIDNLVADGNDAEERLIGVIMGIQNVYIRAYAEETQQRERMDHVHYIDREVITKVFPIVTNLKRAVVDADIQVKSWMAGITTLTHGYISPLLIPEKEMHRILQHVTQSVLKRAMYSNLQLTSTSPGYYYGLKKVSYTHIYDLGDDSRRGSTLYVSLKIPLFRLGGTIPVYRIDVYPVPTTAGLTQDVTGSSSLGWTLLQNMPDFIAVSDNLETYVELNKNLFLTCTGYSEAKICRSGMPLIKKRRSGNPSCAFAIFMEDAHHVLKSCDFRYINAEIWNPYGSAVQLTGDSSFLMHASHHGLEKDRWTLSCPKSKKNPQPPVQTCNMCRISIPCFCSMSTTDFYVPPRYTGCAPLDEARAEESLSYMHHFNMAMVQSLFPKSDEARYLSYQNFTDRQTPAFKIPHITFHVEDNFTEYVHVSDTFSAELKKTLELQKKHLVLYSTKVDAALNITRNFSDQVVDRAGSIEKALQDVFQGLFSSKVWLAISVIFSPLGIMLIASILAVFDFVPDTTTKLCVLFRKRRAKSMYRIVWSKELDVLGRGKTIKRHGNIYFEIK